MNNELEKYAQIPLKQLSNRVWRTYEGGALIDKWKKINPEVDNSLPEQWIMSTVTARGIDRPKHEGLSIIQTDDGQFSLKELIESNKELYLGNALAEKYGRKHFENQNIEGLLDCLHKIEVKAGHAFMIYGGVPHAIGAGCFLMEVQEPTDYTMRVEKTTPKGLKIGPELIHQGVGEEKMLECFHYDTYTQEEALAHWKITPEVLEQSKEFTYRTIFNKKHTTCFGLNELKLDGSYSIKGNGSFFAAVIYSGDGIMTCNGKEYDYSQGDEIFISAAITEITFTSENPTKILLCYPPS